MDFVFFMAKNKKTTNTPYKNPNTQKTNNKQIPMTEIQNSKRLPFDLI